MYNVVLFCFTALLSNALAAVIGFRKVTLCGATLCALSGFISMWAMNIYYVIISLGLLSGKYALWAQCPCMCRNITSTLVASSVSIKVTFCPRLNIFQFILFGHKSGS
jgi:hypothetical protein